MDTVTPRLGMKRPLVVLAIPLVIGGVAWAGFAYLRSTTPEIPLRPSESHSAAEHGPMQLFVLFIMLFVPLAGICFLTSMVMLIRRARQIRAARLALVPVGLLLLAILVLLGLLISDIV